MKFQSDPMQTALKYLGRRSYSQCQLESKLAGAGFNTVEITEALERLLGWGYLNDRQFGMERIRLLIERCKGRAYVSEDLQACGLDPKLVDELLVSEFPMALEIKAAIRFLEKRPASRRHDPAWAFQALTRAGFSEESIRSCLGEPPPT